MAIVTLTTDFGWSDYYVGAMKGVILQIAPNTTIVDVTHEVPPHDILAGALILRELWRSYPPGTVHIGVVDPGVGSERDIILAQFFGQMFLVPDNGLITLIQQMQPPECVNIVSNTQMFCHPVAPTFHGRDIFAPVAAHLSKGTKPHQVGPEASSVELLDVPVTTIAEEGMLLGQVIHIDRYGNLITNIDAEELRNIFREDRMPEVTLGEHPIGQIRRTFAEVSQGATVACIGSARLLEIGINQGRADETLSASIGTRVEVEG